MQNKALEFEAEDFRGVLVIGAAGTGKTLIMEKIFKSYQQLPQRAIYSSNGITDEMKAAIGTNLISGQKQPLYLFLDDAEILNDSYDIKQLLNIGRSNRIQVYLAYASANQIPDGIANRCYLKVVFRASDKASADYCSLMLGEVRERETFPGEYEYKEAVRQFIDIEKDEKYFTECTVVKPSQLLELPDNHFYSVVSGHPCTGEVHSISEIP